MPTFVFNLYASGCALLKEQFVVLRADWKNEKHPLENRV